MSRIKPMRLWWTALGLVIGSWLSAALAATISGTVTDTSGNAIKDAVNNNDTCLG